MTRFELGKYLEKIGFYRLGDQFSGIYRHIYGLEAIIGDHRWSISHVEEGWSEEGVLDETGELFAILTDYNFTGRNF